MLYLAYLVTLAMQLPSRWIVGLLQVSQTVIWACSVYIVNAKIWYLSILSLWRFLGSILCLKEMWLLKPILLNFFGKLTLLVLEWSSHMHVLDRANLFHRVVMMKIWANWEIMTDGETIWCILIGLLHEVGCELGWVHCYTGWVWS